jgi:hypothetical protein
MRKILLVNLLAKQVLPIKSNTYWEEVTCVGFDPDMFQLEAVVSIKRETGYSGGLCSNGSTEYVRFFADWGDGFEDVGHTSFKVYDIPEAPPGPQHPLKYMVYQYLDEQKYRKCCGTAVIPKVRAVLSWNEIPSLDASAIPKFGNRIDADIQIHPKNSLICLIKEIGKELDLPENVDIDAPIPTLKPKPVPWSKLAADYRKAEVPDHRLVYDAVYPMIKGGKALSLSAAQMDISSIAKLKVDIGKITDILSEKKVNTTFEEVLCAGLNTASDMLGAVIHVKKPCGYNGNLCQIGSKEYVAFWADWDNNGTFDSYLGTVSVEVHDIATIPADGLYYSVMLPANFSQHLKNCSNPNIVRVRAVLSWAVPPSTIDPNDLNYWGNSLDVIVQIRPGVSGTDTDLMDLIYDVGNVPISDISTITFLANPSTGILNPSNCNQPAMDRPFGGRVRIGGRIYNTGAPGTVRYQVQYSPHGTNAWLPVTNSVTFELMHPNPFDPNYPKEIKTEVCPDSWIPYAENPTVVPPILERTSLLARWNTGSLQGTYDLRLAYTKDYPITPSSVIHYSDVVTIILDNTNYTVSPTPNALVDTAYNLDLVIDGGDCHSYTKPGTFNGHLRALDTYFWKWVLVLQPTTHIHGTKASPPCRSYGSTVDPGDANVPWSLDTQKLDKCGYTLTLWAYDRTIVDSNGALVHWDRKAVGFSVV